MDYLGGWVLYIHVGIGAYIIYAAWQARFPLPFCCLLFLVVNVGMDKWKTSNKNQIIKKGTLSNLDAIPLFQNLLAFFYISVSLRTPKLWIGINHPIWIGEERKRE